MYSRVLPCPSFNEIRMSPSLGPIVEASLKTRLIPLVRQTDVVENQIDFARRQRLADNIFHLRKELLRFFNARAFGGSYVQPHLPGIHIRKEVFADEEHQESRAHHHQR